MANHRVEIHPPFCPCENCKPYVQISPNGKTKIRSYRDLMYAMASRAHQLSLKKMDELRLDAGYNCSTEYEARQKSKHCNRGQLVEEILIEEFDIDYDRDFEMEE